MTVEIQLTDQWQLIAGGDAVIVSFSGDGGAYLSIGGTSPDALSRGHAVYDGTALSMQADANVYARLQSDDDKGSVFVDEASGTMGVGSGLSLVRIVQSFSLSVR